MSGPLELYRTTINLRGLGAGTIIEIDPTDEGWAADIRMKRIVPAERLPVAKVTVIPEVKVTVIPADGSEPYEVPGVESVTLEHESNGDVYVDGARWPVRLAVDYQAFDEGD